MKFSLTAAVALFAAATEAIVAFTNSAYVVEAGKPFTLQWSGNVGKCTITLKNGPSGNLKTVDVLGSDVSGTSLEWTPPSDLPTDTYAFEIQDESGGQPNYSPQFQFAGSASPSSSATVTSTKTSSTTSGSTSTTTSTSSKSSSTSSSSSSSSSRTSSTSSSTTASNTSRPSNTNDSPKYKSPLAFVLVTVATLVYFN